MKRNFDHEGGGIVIVDDVVEQDKQLLQQKPLSARVFIILLALETILVAGLIAFRLYIERHDANEWRFSVIMLEATVVVVYFAAEGVLNENKYELAAFVVWSAILFAYSLYQFIYAALNHESINIELWLRTIATSACEPANIIVAVFLYKSFGWRIYRLIGADAALQRLYRHYQLLTSMLKVDVTLGLMGITIVALWQHVKLQTVLINIGAVAISLLYAGVTWFAAKRESTWLVLLSLLLSPTRLLYALYELLKVSVNEEPDDLDTWWFGPIVVTGGLGVAVRLALIIITFIVWWGFGQGLKDRVFDRQHLNPSIIGSRTDDAEAEFFLK